MEFHWWNFQFSNDIWLHDFENLFICHLYIFFIEVSIRSLAHFLTVLFVFLLLSFKSSLYIIDNYPISNVCFVNIFSQSVACLLIFLKDESFFFHMIKIHYNFMVLLWFSMNCLFKSLDGLSFRVIWLLDLRRNYFFLESSVSPLTNLSKLASQINPSFCIYGG